MIGFFVHERVALTEPVVLFSEEHYIDGLHQLATERLLPIGTQGLISDQRRVPVLGLCNVVRFKCADFSGFVYLPDSKLVSLEGA